MFDTIIIGAGTAGLTAAIYAARAGMSVLVLEAAGYGGQIVNAPHVENYPGFDTVSGYELTTNLYNQAMKTGAKVEFSKVEKIENVSDGTQTHFAVYTVNIEYQAKSVILATGTKNRPLGLEKEQEWIGRGISYCATCDGAFFKGKDVAVVGGGNTALEDAIFLSNYCNKVYLIHRREGFRGEEKAVEVLKHKENVEMVLNAEIKSLQVENELSEITVIIKNDNESIERNLEISGLFVAIGQIPNNEIFADLVTLNENGYIVAGEDCKTNVEGVFVAGDCRTKQVRQLVTAAADGAVAALAAFGYLAL